jgi:hypothetical protein
MTVSVVGRCGSDADIDKQQAAVKMEADTNRHSAR